MSADAAAHRKESKIMNRRKILFSVPSLALAAQLSIIYGYRPANATQAKFEVMFSDEEWRTRLTPEQFAVLRKAGTEEPFSSPLNTEKRTGNFHCAGCDLPLYASAAKYDSGTGWPSFYESLPQAIGTQPDDTLFTTRTEAHCKRCGGHLGHIFDDGPQPTGKRHCLNGVALAFVPL
jgi:peptide-methionine (R)-S-oxide reductase